MDDKYKLDGMGDSGVTSDKLGRDAVVEADEHEGDGTQADYKHEGDGMVRENASQAGVEGSRSGESREVGYEEGSEETAQGENSDRAFERGLKANMAEKVTEQAEGAKIEEAVEAQPKITEEQAKLLLAQEARKTREGLKTEQKGKKAVVVAVIIGVIICVAAVIFGIVMGS